MARENPWSLDVRDFQLFMKRLRKKFSKQKIRFFHCGEYGDKYNRPHYHSALFNFDFPDKELWRIDNGNKLYTSKILSELWPFGWSTVGALTYESAAYVARYCLKKVTGRAAADHYLTVDENTGEITTLRPEYTTMSRRPGIASNWINQFLDDVYPTDFITHGGKKYRPPKYYDKVLQLTRPYEFDDMKYQRTLNAVNFYANNTPDRLMIREKIQQKKADLLLRNHDQELNQ